MSRVPSEAIEVRGYRSSVDKPFIFSTWLQNYKYSSYFAKRVKPMIFFRGHQKVLDLLFKKPSFCVIVICPKDDLDTILGYLAFEDKEDGHIIHYIFVKEAFRRMGVASTLIKTAGIDINKITFTHWTLPVDEFIRKYPDITYDPYGL